MLTKQETVEYLSIHIHRHLHTYSIARHVPSSIRMHSQPGFLIMSIRNERGSLCHVTLVRRETHPGGYSLNQGLIVHWGQVRVATSTWSIKPNVTNILFKSHNVVKFLLCNGGGLFSKLQNSNKNLKQLIYDFLVNYLNGSNIKYNLSLYYTNYLHT